MAMKGVRFNTVAPVPKLMTEIKKKLSIQLEKPFEINFFLNGKILKQFQERQWESAGQYKQGLEKLKKKFAIFVEKYSRNCSLIFLKF